MECKICLARISAVDFGSIFIGELFHLCQALGRWNNRSFGFGVARTDKGFDLARRRGDHSAFHNDGLELGITGRCEQRVFSKAQ